VARIVPVAYSLDMTSTPKLAPTSCARPAPVRLPPRTVSSGCRLSVAPTNTAIPRTQAASAAKDHTADRNVRSLVHSLTSAARKLARRSTTSFGMVQPSFPVVATACGAGAGTPARYSTLLSVIRM
jgi:hypothetical protein